MRRRIRLSFLLLLSALFLCACHRPAGNTALPDAPLTLLSMRESSAVKERVQGYTFRMEDGQGSVSFHLAGEDDPWVTPVAPPWVDTLTGLIIEHGLLAWDGFHGTAGGLQDGTQFSLRLAFGDGTTVQASGYGAFPPGYREAADAIQAHFLQLLPEALRDW